MRIAPLIEEVARTRMPIGWGTHPPERGDEMALSARRVKFISPSVPSAGIRNQPEFNVQPFIGG